VVVKGADGAFRRTQLRVSQEKKPDSKDLVALLTKGKRLSKSLPTDPRPNDDTSKKKAGPGLNDATRAMPPSMAYEQKKRFKQRNKPQKGEVSLLLLK